MTRRVGFTPEAELELLQIVGWYDDRNPGLGDAFVVAMSHSIAAIGRSPGRGAPIGHIDDLDIRRIATARFPYQVIYLTTTDAVIVLAIAHQHRRPNYWNERLS